MNLYDPSLEADAVFTGIIQQLGKVVSMTPGQFGARLVINRHDWTHRPCMGDSIAVNGCCLTVAAGAAPGGEQLLQFDVIQQTLTITTMGGLKPGDLVNLEHAVTPQTLLGGHIVQGHIDGVGTIAVVRSEAHEHRLRIKAPAELMDGIVPQGSIAVDGVSLTIAAVGPDWLEVALIPTTLQLTTLGSLRKGSNVNLEVDYLAKVVINHLRRSDR